MQLLPADLQLPEKFSIWRPEQFQLAEQITNSPKKFVILASPTGTGKSLVAMTVAQLKQWKCLEEQCREKFETFLDAGIHRRTKGHRIAPRSRIVYAVPTKSLQRQLAGDFDYITDLMGKSNYDCGRYSDFSCDDCPFAATGDIPVWCKGKGDETEPNCKYYVKRREAFQSGKVVLNYAYWFNIFDAELFDSGQLLVCDEAHELESAVVNNNSYEITENETLRFNIALPISSPDFLSVQSTLEAFKNKLELHIKDEIIKVKTIMGKNDISKQEKAQIRQLKADKTLLADVAGFLYKFNLDQFVIKTGTKPLYDKRRRQFHLTHKLIIQPIWASPWAPRYFRGFYKVLFMSATILDKRVFCQSMGIPEEDTEFIRVDESLFPKDRRPIIYLEAGRITRDNEVEMMPIITQIIDALMDKHPNEKGIIHTSSNKNAEFIVNNSKHQDRITTHIGRNREGAITRFKNSSEPLVMVSPSLTTGESFDYDMARWQVLTRAPYADLSDERVRKRLEQRPLWYVMDMLSKVIQSYGRVCRAQDDYGVTYILDQKIMEAINQHRVKLPAWFLEAFTNIV